MNPDDVYRRSPVPLQNLMATAYGLKERRTRYTGDYERFVRELEERQWWDGRSLDAEQDDRVRRIVHHAAHHVPYYRDLFADLGISPRDIQRTSDLELLPVLEKQTVREQPDRFVSELHRGSLISQTTGGTTGTPLRYYATPKAVQFNYATYEARFRRWAGVGFGTRMATMNGKVIVPGDKPPFWRSNPAFNQLYFSVYHLSVENLPQYVARMAAFAPEVLVGYTSAVHTLADFVNRTGREGLIRPRAVLVSSETVWDWTRRDIERAFGCRLWNGYSLGELVAFISECERGTMHVSPEYGVVEILEGSDGLEIIATGLANFGMPLIRYRTGDLVTGGTSAERCDCGRALPVVGQILGRVDEFIVTPTGSKVGPAPLSLAFQDVPRLKSAQLYQVDAGGLTVRIVADSAFSNEDEAFLMQQLRARLGQEIELRIERIDSPELTVSGKQRLIMASIPS